MQREKPYTGELINVSGDSRQDPRLSEALGVHSKATLRGNAGNKNANMRYLRSLNKYFG